METALSERIDGLWIPVHHFDDVVCRILPPTPFTKRPRCLSTKTQFRIKESTCLINRAAFRNSVHDDRISAAMRLGDYISPMRELGVPDKDITLAQRHRNYAKTLVEAPLYHLLLISINICGSKKFAVERRFLFKLLLYIQTYPNSGMLMTVNHKNVYLLLSDIECVFTIYFFLLLPEYRLYFRFLD